MSEGESPVSTGRVLRSDRVGVGLVGSGMSASSLHLPLIGAEPGLELRGVVTSHPERAPGLPVRPTVDALLDDPAVELVVVAVPNAAHHDVARTALEAGRHVVVDKPFTVTSAEADDLIRLAGERDLRLSVFHQRRWDADHRTIRRVVDEGLLGRVGTYLARYDRFLPGPPTRWTERDGPGSGVLYDLGAHLIDQAVHLFGPPARRPSPGRPGAGRRAARRSGRRSRRTGTTRRRRAPRTAVRAREPAIRRAG